MGKAVWRIAANDRAGVAWASGKRPDRTPNRIRHLHFDFWSGSTASPVNDAAMTTNDAEELCDRFMTAKRPTGGLRSFCEEQPCDDLVGHGFQRPARSTDESDLPRANAADHAAHRRAGKLRGVSLGSVARRSEGNANFPEVP